MSDGKKYNGLINFLNASRSELITDVDNLTALLKKADTKADDEGSSLASGAVYLLQSVTKVLYILQLTRKGRDILHFITLVPNFFNNVFLYVSLTTLGTFIEF